MKRMSNPNFMILFLSLAVLLSCATAPVKPITQADLPDLKGEWKGFYQERGGRFSDPIELEIISEDLEGNWTWHHANRPPYTFPFDGKIENGRILCSWPGGQVNLGLRKGHGKMKLEGDFQLERWEGTMYLNKVK